LVRVTEVNVASWQAPPRLPSQLSWQELQPYHPGLAAIKKGILLAKKEALPQGMEIWFRMDRKHLQLFYNKVVFPRLR
jgi:hypothetical protein